MGFCRWTLGHYDDAFSSLKLGGKNNIFAASACKPLAGNTAEVVCLHTELDLWFLE